MPLKVTLTGNRARVPNVSAASAGRRTMAPPPLPASSTRPSNSIRVTVPTVAAAGAPPHRLWAHWAAHVLLGLPENFGPVNGAAPAGPSGIVGALVGVAE